MTSQRKQSVSISSKRAKLFFSLSDNVTYHIGISNTFCHGFSAGTVLPAKFDSDVMFCLQS